MKSPCIIVYDDQDCVALPMAFDDECDGAVCAASAGDKVALFQNHAEARKAIEISTRFALLRKAQGGIINTDYLGENRKHIRIIPCELRPAAAVPKKS